MKTRISVAILAVLFLGLAVMGCTGPTEPSEGINIVITNTQTQGGSTGPTGTASPTPGGATLPPGSYVSIGVFGRSCPSGITDVPSGLRQFRAGCVYDVTATPRDSSQKELGTDVAGPVASWAQPVPAGIASITVAENSYNIQLRAGPGLGTVTLSASVKGTVGTGDYLVVQ